MNSTQSLRKSLLFSPTTTDDDVGVDAQVPKCNSRVDCCFVSAIGEHTVSSPTPLTILVQILHIRKDNSYQKKGGDPKAYKVLFARQFSTELDRFGQCTISVVIRLIRETTCLCSPMLNVLIACVREHVNSDIQPLPITFTTFFIVSNYTT